MKDRPPIIATVVLYLVFSFALYCVRYYVPFRLAEQCSAPILFYCSVVWCFFLPAMVQRFKRMIRPAGSDASVGAGGSGGSFAGVLLVVLLFLPAAIFLVNALGWHQSHFTCPFLSLSLGFLCICAFYIMYASITSRRRCFLLGMTTALGFLTVKIIVRVREAAGDTNALSGTDTEFTLWTFGFAAVAAVLAVLIILCLLRLPFPWERPDAGGLPGPVQPGAGPDSDKTGGEAAGLAGRIVGFFRQEFSPGYDGALPPYYQRIPLDANRRGRIVLLFLAFLAIVIVNGLLGVIFLFYFNLFQIAFTGPLQYIIPVTMAVMVPTAGWLVDRNPDVWALRILVTSGFLFLTAPSLAVIGKDESLFTIVHAITTTGQMFNFIVIATALSGLSTTPAEATLYTALLFGLRYFSVLIANLFNHYPSLISGVRVLLTTVLVGCFIELARRALALPQPQTESTWDIAQPTSDTVLIERPADADAASAATATATAAESPDADLASPLAEELPSKITASYSVRDTSNAALPISAWPLSADELTRAIDKFLDSAGLTPREREIAAELLGGRTTRIISRNLGISENTVNYHIKNILEKFGVTSRQALLARFINARDR